MVPPHEGTDEELHMHLAHAAAGPDEGGGGHGAGQSQGSPNRDERGGGPSLRNNEPAPMPLAGQNHVQVGPMLRKRHKLSQLNEICLLEEDPIPGKRKHTTL